EKRLGDVEIIPDSDVFPKPTVYIPTPLKANVATVEQDAYFKQSKEKYFTEGGMRVVNLGEVTVKAAKKEPASNTYYYSGGESALITSEKLKQFPGQNISQILPIIIACNVYTDEKNVTRITVDGNQELRIVIDNMDCGGESLKYLNLDEVESISVYKGADAAIFGTRGYDGVIAISLKKGKDWEAQTPITMTKVTPLGYQKPAEFYVPKYNVDSIRLSDKADLRTTIYWNPKLETDDNGNVHVKFYTGDKANNYSVVMEGISTSGEICRYVGMLKREDKR
ncbi:MAG TPA: TonB-dependent receptor plug domain-containing protein, partial [Paludibacter sp.]|nr:TonB-dependent receptor plug domain-containing protein [Paludibacter sp.]